MANYLKSGQMSHKAFQQWVIKLARMAGFDHVYFTWNSRHSPVGFPDLVMLKGPRMVVAELKVGKDKVRPEQQAWLEAFQKITKDVFVWKPEDMEEIHEVLFEEVK